MPASTTVFESALLHSADAFERFDRWTGHRSIEALTGGLAEQPGDAASPLAAYPLAPLLTTPSADQRYTGLPAIKALLLVGFARAQPDYQPGLKLAEGALKAVRLAPWKRELPAALTKDATLLQAIDHCRSHAEVRLAAPAGLSGPVREWLAALRRWCEILSKPVPGATLVIPRSSPSYVTVPIDDDDQEPDPPPRPLLIDQSDDADAPEFDEPIDTDDRAPPVADAPEPHDVECRASVGTEGAPETEAGGKARRARTGFRTALENQFLPWANAQLILDDRAQLVIAMKEGLRSLDENASDAVGLLAIAHVTGQLVEQAAELSLVPVAEASYLADGRALMRYVPPQANAWAPNEHQAARMRPRVSHVRLDLPLEIVTWLAARLRVAKAPNLVTALTVTPLAAVDGARVWLETLRAATGGLQTLGRAEWWLPHALYQTMRDHVPSRLLCAVNDGQPCPSAYYRAYEVHALATLHSKTLATAGWTMPPGADAGAVAKAWVGSQLNLELDVVKAMWAATTGHFEAIVSDKAQPLHVRHNARECHEALSQMFQTFHRLVGDPLESLEFIDLERQRLVIDDKQQGEARAHRLVPLATLATRQCVEQIDHVRRLAIALAPTAPDTAARLMTMIERPHARAAPFRFLLSERNEIVRLTPGALKRALGTVWGLPLNLARHFGSTWLMEQGANDEELISMLGHFDLGTQNLSMLSPRYFGSLFGEPADPHDEEAQASGLHAKLDELVEALGLRSIASFLPPLADGAVLPRAKSLPQPMHFGHQRRAHARSMAYAKVRQQVDELIITQLDARKPATLVQDDIEKLFEQIRKTTPNRRTHWACVRFEALRAALLDLLHRQDKDTLKLELPAVALVVKDIAHQCPLDGLAAAQWLRQCRRELWAHWRSELVGWRAARTQVHVASPESLVLTLVVDSLVLDPDVWKCWLGGTREFSVFIDDRARSWIRMPLPNRNSRLYPVQRVFAEMLQRVPVAAWQRLDLEQVTAFANGLARGSDAANARLRDFGQLLNRVQGASAAETPGLVLGYADGSHQAVSPESLCLERAGGQAPTAASVAAWHARRRTSTDETDTAVVGTVSRGANGKLSDEAAFRRAMATSLTKLERATPGERAAGKSQTEARVTMAAKKGTGRSRGPLTRFVDALDSQWDDLVCSPRLAPACGLTAQWLHRLAKFGQPSGENYAGKTLRNYWYSWCLRVIEEFGTLDPRSLSPAEMEELYLQIVEDAQVENRQHLYPPLRNWHRYLVMSHGVCEIDWTELRSATGHGVTHVDANLVFDDEYFVALDLLREDQAVSERVRVLQAAALVLLYRGGLRIAECLGLRATDLYLNEADGLWRVRVRGNLYRSLKTDNARRTVVILETLTEVESQVLRAWSAHVKTFLSARALEPLFAQTRAGEGRRSLFPRRIVALRVAQALRAATGDPGTRIHHCRHAFATRILNAGLGVSMAPDNETSQGHAARLALTEHVRRLLTSEPDATRRLLWAVAAMLGHASPMTTLETYAHAGHEWLHNWCSHTVWNDIKGLEVDVGEWLAFACAVTVKTMQRAYQRAAADGRPVGDVAAKSGDATRRSMSEKDRARVAIATWTRVPRLGVGRRVQRETALPPLRLVEGSSTLQSVDRIVDHARKFGRVDGLAERLFVSETWIEKVLRAAAAFGARHRSGRIDPDRWWIVSHDVNYPEHEGAQVDVALERLERMPADELAEACSVIDRLIDPARRMVVIEEVEDLMPVVRLSTLLVDDPQFIKLLVPAKLPRRPTPEERMERDKAAMQRAVAEKRPYRREKPRQRYAATITFEQAAAIVACAKSLGISAVSEHGRVAKARGQPHDSLSPSARFGLTLQENAVDVMRSAKVYTRVLAAATVACEASALAEEVRAKQRLKKQEHSKASVRAKVEHPFRVIKLQFGLAKVRS